MRLFLLLSFCGIFTLTSAQQISPKGYYVIVGAFAIKENAERFSQELQKQRIKSQCVYQPQRKLYYAFTYFNVEKLPCQREALTLRNDPRFFDAWVKYIDFKDPDALEPPIRSVSLVETQNEETGRTQEEPRSIEVKGPPEQVTLKNVEIFLSLYDPRTDKVAEGNVQVIDTERARLIEEVKGNSYLTLTDPKSKSGMITLICDVIGYRKMQKEIDFNNPLRDSSVVENWGTSLVVNFELIRYVKGDIRTLYNIYFYNDAAIMMPESKFELNGLLDMMQEKPTYRIRLHGHTNGGYFGKIVKRKPDGDFFDLTDASVTTGSAKELSASRAGIIRSYLIAQGIGGDRIEIKAWGGKRPLFDKNSANAKRNVRVEVEIIED
jgi:outer membrane protein OmpA-like peptidoglycan-associated protein